MESAIWRPFWNKLKEHTLWEKLKSDIPEDIEELLSAGRQAAIALQSASPMSISSFLELYAEKIEGRPEDLAHIASLETALPKETRLGKIELARTTGQLRQAAAACRDLSWCHATIDTNTNIRSCLNIM